jgi:hypothetical protein
MGGARLRFTSGGKIYVPRFMTNDSGILHSSNIKVIYHENLKCSNVGITDGRDL